MKISGVLILSMVLLSSSMYFLIPQEETYIPVPVADNIITDQLNETIELLTNETTIVEIIESTTTPDEIENITEIEEIIEDEIIPINTTVIDLLALYNTTVSNISFYHGLDVSLTVVAINAQNTTDIDFNETPTLETDWVSEYNQFTNTPIMENGFMTIEFDYFDYEDEENLTFWLNTTNISSIITILPSNITLLEELPPISASYVDDTDVVITQLKAAYEGVEPLDVITNNLIQTGEKSYIVDSNFTSPSIRNNPETVFVTPYCNNISFNMKGTTGWQLKMYFGKADGVGGWQYINIMPNVRSETNYLLQNFRYYNDGSRIGGSAAYININDNTTFNYNTESAQWSLVDETTSTNIRSGYTTWSMGRDITFTAYSQTYYTPNVNYTFSYDYTQRADLVATNIISYEYVETEDSFLVNTTLENFNPSLTLEETTAYEIRLHAEEPTTEEFKVVVSDVDPTDNILIKAFIDFEVTEGDRIYQEVPFTFEDQVLRVIIPKGIIPTLGGRYLDLRGDTEVIIYDVVDISVYAYYSNTTDGSGWYDDCFNSTILRSIEDQPANREFILEQTIPGTSMFIAITIIVTVLIIAVLISRVEKKEEPDEFTCPPNLSWDDNKGCI